jgi:hypothetical protein
MIKRAPKPSTSYANTLSLAPSAFVTSTTPCLQTAALTSSPRSRTSFDNNLSTPSRAESSETVTQLMMSERRVRATEAKAFDGIKNWRTVASSDGRKADLMRPVYNQASVFVALNGCRA